MDRIELAKWLHENYEAIAKDKKWNTQENCKVEFDTLPDANKSTMIEIADRLLNFNLLSKHFVSGSFLADEFHEWIELNDWQFNPVSFNGVIKYRWVNETYSGQATTKDLYEIFLSQNGKPLVSCRCFMVFNPMGEDWEQMSIALKTFEEAKAYYDRQDRKKYPYLRILAELSYNGS